MKKIYTIGRDEGCDIVIPDNTDVISRLHATIRIESNDKIFLIDQSRNGTYVNGMKMSSNVEIPVSREDVISFAHIYNLDWSLVPKYKGNYLKNGLIALLCLIVLAGIAIPTYNYLVNKAEGGSTAEPPTAGPVASSDSVEQKEKVVHDTVVVVKETPQTEKVQEEKDSVEVEKKEEEVFDPIY